MVVLYFVVDSVLLLFFLEWNSLEIVAIILVFFTADDVKVTDQNDWKII